MLCRPLTSQFVHPQDDRIFVEFGSGRGQLSYWIVKATKEAKNVRYVLVDKESHRHKFDNKLKDEVPEAEVLRIRADILNLVLGNVPGIKGETNSVVAVSKHLCGAATDFALQCVSNFAASTDSRKRSVKNGANFSANRIFRSRLAPKVFSLLKTLKHFVKTGKNSLDEILFSCPTLNLTNHIAN